MYRKFTKTYGLVGLFLAAALSLSACGKTTEPDSNNPGTDGQTPASTEPTSTDTSPETPSEETTSSSPDGTEASTDPADSEQISGELTIGSGLPNTNQILVHVYSGALAAGGFTIAQPSTAQGSSAIPEQAIEKLQKQEWDLAIFETAALAKALEVSGTPDYDALAVSLPQDLVALAPTGEQEEYVPVIRSAKAHDLVTDIINTVSAHLTTEEIAKLTAEPAPDPAIANEWLEAKGLAPSL